MTDKTSQDMSKVSFKIGVGLLLTAGLLWLGVVGVPFLPVETAMKVGIVGVLLVAGEVAFWLGAILTGKEFVARYKQHLDPRNWKRRG